MTTTALASLPEPSSEDDRESAQEHLEALGIVPTPAQRTDVERLSISGTEPNLRTYYDNDAEVGLQIRKGGHEHADSAKHGRVVVALGLDLEAAAQIDVDVPGRWVGMSAIDVLNASIAHQTILRDQLVRLSEAITEAAR